MAEQDDPFEDSTRNYYEITREKYEGPSSKLETEDYVSIFLGILVFAIVVVATAMKCSRNQEARAAELKRGGLTSC